MEEEKTEKKEISNSLTGLVQSFSLGQQFTAQASQTDTFQVNLRHYFLSNNRHLLNWLYVEHGIVQTLIDQPVDDALRGGVTIKTNILDADDLDSVHTFMERTNVIQKIAQATKWARLFGGAAILLISDQDYTKPFNANKLTKDSRLEFRAVDMWELARQEQAPLGETSWEDPEFYMYYGHKIHKSHLFIIKGKEAPSMIRSMLRGWGMSEVERAVRSVSQYLKNQNVVFELLDEAKIDVMKIQGMNESLATSNGTNLLSKRVQAAASIKNYQNALIMDKDDEYDQKQMSFSGLSEILNQIRQSVAADLKMPMTKLFGLSSAGFNSGEDDIENYNSMVEGEVRAKIKFVISDVIDLCCRIVLGVSPEDLKIEFQPLRILGAKEQEDVKTQQFTRIMQAFDRGLSDTMETKENINRGGLLPSEIAENDELTIPDGTTQNESE